MLEKMRPIIAEQLNVQESEIKENTKLKEDLGADSLDPVSYTHLTLPTKLEV